MALADPARAGSSAALAALVALVALASLVALAALPALPMTALVLCFEVHQPYRLRREGERARDAAGLFDDAANERILPRVAARC